MLEGYATRDVPNITIRLMENDEPVYEIILDKISDYYEHFGTPETRIEIYTQILNPQDRDALVNKIYDKYVIESEELWYNTETSERETIEHPAMVFHNFTIENDLHNNGEPTTWLLTFWEEHQNG